MSMGLGFVHIFTGMGLSAWRKIKKGHAFDALCDEGFWYLVLIGLVLGLVGVTFGFYIAIAGVVGILIFGGRHKPTVLGKLRAALRPFTISRATFPISSPTPACWRSASRPASWQAS